jgi:hypothetical protein
MNKKSDAEVLRELLSNYEARNNGETVEDNGLTVADHKMIERMNGVGAALLMLVMAGLLIGGLIHVYRESTYDKEYASVWSDFESDMEKQSMRRRLVDGAAYRRGLMHVVNFEVLRRLPSEICASSPDECGTLVLIREEKQLEGTKYSNGAIAKRWELEVILIDCKEHAVIGRKKFLGGAPPREVYIEHSEGIGSRPFNDIGSWLAQLPVGPHQSAEFR